jgi:hypothetical protein
VTSYAPRLTRIVIDHDCGIEVAQLQALTERIQELLPNASVLERDYIANALLSLALGMLDRRGGLSELR